MKHLTLAYAAGRSTPANDEAHGSPQTAGPKDHETQYAQSNPPSVPNKEAEGDCSIFSRLSRQFAAVGLGLYPLDGSTLLVTAPRLGMHKTLPDLRSAKIYLRHVAGGCHG